MEQYIEIITINLIPGGMKPACHASQYDKGRVIRANLVNGLTPYSIKSGDVFTLNVKKPDGNIVTVEVEATEGNTYVDFSTTEQMCAVAGKNNCEFSIENGSDLIGTANFYMIVEASPLEGGVPSQSEINNLNRQIDRHIDEVLPEQIEDVAEPIVRELVPELVSNDYAQKLTQTLKVGENILTEGSVVLGANWSGSIESGFTHTSGSTEPLTFNLATTSGKAYLVTFDATGVNNTTALNVRIGNLPDVDIYTGRTDFNVGFVADGGNLKFTPQSNYSGTITNLKLREITDEGNEVTFEVKNVNTNADNSGISGFWNVALGFSSFEHNINGSRNVAVGFQSLQAFKTGTRNLALGTYAMNRLESGDRNIAVGADSMWYAQKASDCIAFGHNAMSGVGTDLEKDIAIGRDTMGVITTGKNNVAIGYAAMVSPQTNSVSNSTCIGANAGNYAHTYSTYIGSRAGYHMKGISNTCIGYNSGAAQYASGARNTFIGATCGIDNTGATAQNPKNVDDSIVIGYGAKATKSKQIMLGSTDVTEVVICGNKKINFNQDGTVTWEPLT